MCHICKYAPAKPKVKGQGSVFLPRLWEDLQSHAAKGVDAGKVKNGGQ